MGYKFVNCNDLYNYKENGSLVKIHGFVIHYSENESAGSFLALVHPSTVVKRNLGSDGGELEKKIKLSLKRKEQIFIQGEYRIIEFDKYIQVHSANKEDPDMGRLSLTDPNKFGGLSLK